MRPGIELLLVLGVSLGQSAVYSILSIIEKLTRNTPLNQQTTSMNNSVVPDRPWLDLSYQVAGLVFPLVPALFALYLLQRTGDRRADRLRPAASAASTSGWGFGAGRRRSAFPGWRSTSPPARFGLNTNVSPANLAANWWTVPVLIGAALMNAVLEEVVMIGFWFVRGRATELAGVGGAASPAPSCGAATTSTRASAASSATSSWAWSSAWPTCGSNGSGRWSSLTSCSTSFAFVGYSPCSPRYVDWL